MPIADLPGDLWKKVLQHVPLKQRLTSCALVCHKLHAASTTATDSIQASLSGQLSMDIFLEYLQQYGSQLTSISLYADKHVEGWLMVQQQLPSCQHLQQLSLKGFDVQLSPAEGLPGALDSLTGLTRLELRDCGFNSGRSGGAAALSVLVNLQHLCFKRKQNTLRLYSVSDLVWPCLQQLTHLELAYVKLEGEDLRGVSRLTQLKVLHLNAPRCWLDSTAPNTFPFPASLQHLCFTGDFGPGALEGALQLTGLELYGGSYRVNAAADDSDDFYDSDDEVYDEGGRYLLGVLPKLQHLSTLKVCGLQIDWPPSSPDYTALVPSILRSLTLGADLFEGAWAHVFSTSPPRALQLTKLELPGVFIFKPSMDPGNIRAMVSCCPLLQELLLKVQAGPHLTSLTQLSALTRLELVVASDSDADITVATQCLSGLTSLLHLELYPRKHDRITDEALLPLTALRQLTRLKWGPTHHKRATLRAKVGSELYLAQPHSVRVLGPGQQRFDRVDRHSLLVKLAHSIDCSQYIVPASCIMFWRPSRWFDHTHGEGH